MTKRLCGLMAVAAVSAAFVAGCGGSSSSSSSAAPAAATSTPAAATSSSATATASSATSSGGLASNPTIQAAVARCKQSIAAAPTLSSDAKSKLTTLCDKAATGDEASVLKAAKQVCIDIVKQSVPQSAQQAALAACQKSSETMSM
jgi:hypothetical protein